VVHNGLVFGSFVARISDNMRNRNKLAILSSHTAVCRKFARAECGHKCSGTVDPGIAIGSVRGDEFIRVSFPLQAIVLDKIKKCKFVIYEDETLFISCLWQFVLPPGTPNTDRTPSSWILLNR
jgi:hypothetical protein